MSCCENGTCSCNNKPKEEEQQILIEDGTMAAFGFNNEAEVKVKDEDKKKRK